MIPEHVFSETLLQFLTPVLQFLDDPSVSEVMINGPTQIFVERRGRLELTGARFESSEALESALCNMAQYAGKRIDASMPILEGRLPDGSRVEAVLPPAAPLGPFVAIRRFSLEALTVDKLVDGGSLTPDAARALSVLVASKFNILVAGGTGSGKTSLLNALSSFIPGGERVVVIEDSRELQLQQGHVVGLQARPADARGRGAVTVRDLFRATLRLRPDRIVVGEIRGGEALDLIQAMTSGHGGCLSTLHATYPHDTLSRLETMAMMSDVQMPLAALRVQLASAVDLVVQTARLSDGSRKVTHITEVVDFSQTEGRYTLRDLFVRRFESDAFGALRDELVPSGRPPLAYQRVLDHGFELPACMLGGEAPSEQS
ncbi:MAG: CpaF family protein [Polyangiaceae bacterium]